MGVIGDAMLVRMNVDPRPVRWFSAGGFDRARAPISLYRRPYRNTGVHGRLPKTEAWSEADDARTLSMVRNRRGARRVGGAHGGALGRLRLGDDVRTLLRLLERMSHAQEIW